ncbi:MAG: hypothetical protein QOD03_279 [Verrucomicrobiota bacterium]|jgi:hypothetical protein
MKPKLLLCFALVLSGNCYAAIVYPKAPDGGRQMAVENAGRILRGDSNFFGGLRIEDLTTVAPHREYYLTNLAGLASGHLLSATTSRSWQYLLVDGTNNAVGAAMLIEDGNKALKFATLQRSFFPDAILVALRAAEKLPQIKKQNYEVRYLVIDSVSFMAVWLHAESDDIIIPLPPTFGRFNDYQPYSESRIIKVLKKDAANVIKQTNLLR